MFSFLIIFSVSCTFNSFKCSHLILCFITTFIGRWICFLLKLKRSSSKNLFSPSDSEDEDESELVLQSLNASTGASLCSCPLPPQTADPRFFFFFGQPALSPSLLVSCRPLFACPPTSIPTSAWWGGSVWPPTPTIADLSAAFSDPDCSCCSVAHVHKHVRAPSTSSSLSHRILQYNFITPRKSLSEMSNLGSRFLQIQKIWHLMMKSHG